MRKIVILAVLGIVSLTGLEVRAAQGRVRAQVTSGQGQGPVRTLVDMERRKNAALRQMFFGR